MSAYLDQMILDEALIALSLAEEESSRLAGKTEHGVALRLETRYGTLLSTEQSVTRQSQWFKDRLGSLSKSSQDVDSIYIESKSDSWEGSARLDICDDVFIPVVRWMNPPEAKKNVREIGLLILDLFSETVKTRLTEYFQNEPIDQSPAEDSAKYQVEQTIINHAAQLSSSIECIALTDEDGFVLYAEGPSEKAQQIAANLARFNRRTIRAFGAMQDTELSHLTFIGSDSAALIGKVAQTGLTLAISAKGNACHPLVTLAFGNLQKALGDLGQKAGFIWGAPLEVVKPKSRIRDSWFEAAKLIPKGAFSSKKGSKVFHSPQCRLLSKTDPDSLKWYETRADAVMAGMRPCRTCRP